MNNNVDFPFKDFSKVVGWIILVAVSVTIVSQWESMSETPATRSMMALGTFFTGIGTIGIMLIALIKFPSEMEKWRDQKLEELETKKRNRHEQRKEEAAIAGMEAFERAEKAYNILTNPLSYQVKKDDGTWGDHFLETYQFRMNLIKEEIDFYYKSALSLHMYFDADIVSNYGKIDESLVNARHQVALFQSGDEQERREAVREFYSRNPKKEIADSKLFLRLKLSVIINPDLAT